MYAIENTGYVRFMNVRREELRKSHPNTSANDMTKMIGEDWNSLNENDRKPYMEAAKMDKERFVTTACPLCPCVFNIVH